jgi:NADH-quinone oxidoreductase subunit D
VGGVVTPERALQMGFTGPMLRGSGIAWDLRKKQPYEVYDQLDFDIPVGKNGDCYDRYLRVEEMRQSNRIIKQCVDWLRNNPVRSSPTTTRWRRPRVGHEVQHGRADPPLQAVHRRHPRAGRRGLRRRRASEGRVRHLPGLDGANKPYRLKIRARALPTWPRSTKWPGHMIADAVTIIGTQDIVFGEIDR